MIRQATPAVLPTTESWPAQGNWTYDDYLRLPDDGRRYEIIKGVLYVTNAPAYDHQYAVSQIFFALMQFVKANLLGTILPAPFEIHLPGIARPVLPDIVFIGAARSLPDNARFFEGAPDLIVEVLSPSTIRIDQSVKLDAYEQAGVPEYWLADPKTRTVTIYALPVGGQEYVLHGRFGPDETLTSPQLAGLELPVASLFLPATA
ncbi:MAG TPA: Uma2 family endonuclease [Chloroflexota bacterium]|nr:Uma2 family endonuclease [Chloroflexota bacterium]HUM70733.1 Uma2 family endonuclease [Chloroflexota bacterium]